MILVSMLPWDDMVKGSDAKEGATTYIHLLKLSTKKMLVSICDG